MSQEFFFAILLEVQYWAEQLERYESIRTSKLAEIEGLDIDVASALLIESRDDWFNRRFGYDPMKPVLRWEW